MKAIRLSGKYATGSNTYAIVDVANYKELNQYKWKAKFNRPGGNCYAIRTSMINGKMCDIRMHRVVLDYNGRLDVDHINHNSLDNRISNLRAVTRSVNVVNRTPSSTAKVCKGCNKEYISNEFQTGKVYCSSVCRPKPEVVSVVTIHEVKSCTHCHNEFMPKISLAQYCGESCRKKAKYQRDKAAGKSKAQYLRDWRANKAAGKIMGSLRSL